MSERRGPWWASYWWQRAIMGVAVATNLMVILSSSDSYPWARVVSIVVVVVLCWAQWRLERSRREYARARAELDARATPEERALRDYLMRRLRPGDYPLIAQWIVNRHRWDEMDAPPVVREYFALVDNTRRDD